MTKWDLLDSHAVLSTPWISVYKNQYRTKDGEIVDDYYVVKRSDFVLIVAIKDGRLILVQQYRPATDQSYLGLPAGYLDSDEPPEVAAKRELMEETGYSANKCTLAGELHPLPGYIHSTAYVVMCEEISKSGTSNIDSFEIDRVLEISWAEALEMIAQGRINEMQAVAAILLVKEILLKRDPCAPA